MTTRRRADSRIAALTLAAIVAGCAAAEPGRPSPTIEVQASTSAWTPPARVSPPDASMTPSPSPTPTIRTDPGSQAGPTEIHIVSKPRLTPRKMQIAIWTPNAVNSHDGVATSFVLRAGHRDLINFSWWAHPTTITAGYRFECQLRVDLQPWTILALVVNVPDRGPCSIEILATRPLPRPSAP